MSSEQQKRKQLEKAIQDKLKKSGKVPVTPPAQTTSAQSKTTTQPTSLLAKTSTQDMLQPLQKAPMSRRAPSPEPDSERPITTFLEPIKPKKPLKAKPQPKERTLAELEKRHLNFGNWEWYTAYRLMPFVLWWIFIQPQKYVVYTQFADDKHRRIMKATVDITSGTLLSLLLAIPMISVLLGLSPAYTPWLLAHGIDLNKWFIALMGLSIIRLASVPFHMSLQDDLNIPLYIFRFSLRAINYLFMTAIIIVVTAGIVLRSREEFLFICFLTFIIAVIMLGMVMATKTEDHSGPFTRPLDRWFNTLAEDIVGKGLRDGEPSLVMMFLFCILVGAFGFIIWIYLLDGWMNFCACPMDVSGVDPFRRYRG